jgi:hypothetical protein
MAINSRILDTNILIHANGDQSPQTTAECKNECLKLIMSAMARDYQIVIDGGVNPDGSEVLSEYRNKLNEAGSGFGEMFLRWIAIHWQEHILVPITKKDESYEEFPDDERLKDFDPRDRKWIATAVSCKTYLEIQPDIMQSADFKWEKYQEIFHEHNVSVIFICPNPDETS